MAQNKNDCTHFENPPQFSGVNQLHDGFMIPLMPYDAGVPCGGSNADVPVVIPIIPPDAPPVYTQGSPGYPQHPYPTAAPYITDPCSGGSGEIFQPHTWQF